MENKMFCWQCQETAGNKGCTQSGVCGKDPKTAGIQDLLIYATKGISAVATRLRAEGKPVNKEINHLVTQNLFTTITNANFDRDDIAKRVHDLARVHRELFLDRDDDTVMEHALKRHIDIDNLGQHLL